MKETKEVLVTPPLKLKTYPQGKELADGSLKTFTAQLRCLSESDPINISCVDWVTLTLQESTYLENMELVLYLEKLMQKRGGVLRNWQTPYVSGMSVGQLKFGQFKKSATSYQVVVSGLLSSVLASLMPTCAKTTRIDYAIDIYYPNEFMGNYDFYHKFHKQLQADSGGTAKTRFWDGDGFGWTFYHGRGGEGYLLRIYDKGAQIKNEPGLWIRVELQIGRLFATNARARWIEAPNKERYIGDIIAWYCRKHSIALPYGRLDDVKFVPCSRWVSGESEVDKATKWLRNIVKPFIDRYVGMTSTDDLIRELDLGYRVKDFVIFKHPN